jgi:membrane-associated phospholipid phosphatase
VVQGLKFEVQGLPAGKAGSKFEVRRMVFVLIVFLFSLNLKSQNDSIPANTKLNGKYLLSYWTDTKTIVASPFHWKGKQWLTFAGVVGTTAILYAYDEKIYNFVQDNKSSTTNDISKYVIEPWGSGEYSIPLLAGIFLTGKKGSRHRTIALTGLKAFLLTSGATYFFKYTFHRHRPDENNPPDPRRWEGPFPVTKEHLSFPSGHTSNAFAVASVLAYGYRDKIWVGITSYSIATLVGLSRMNDSRHWASDVLAGAALGTFIGVTLSKVNLKKVDFYPTSYHGGYGLGATIKL